MKFTYEQLEKARSAKSVDELLKFAEDEGIELTKEDAEKYLAFLAGDDTELPDEALDAVAGGKGEKPDPKYYVGQKLWRYYETTMSWEEMEITSVDKYNERDGYKYYYRFLNYENTPILADYLDHKQVYTYDPREQKGRK